MRFVGVETASVKCIYCNIIIRGTVSLLLDLLLCKSIWCYKKRGTSAGQRGAVKRCLREVPEGERPILRSLRPPSFRAGLLVKPPKKLGQSNPIYTSLQALLRTADGLVLLLSHTRSALDSRRLSIFSPC